MSNLINRRTFMQSTTLAAAGLSMHGLSRAAGRKKMNVLFIAVDDLRPQLGCYGHKEIHTPNIDALAERGIVFNRAYCQQAVCNPSRASLLSGLRPDTTRIYNLSTHFRQYIPNAVTLPEYFKQNGYHTMGLSKIYHGGLDDPKSWSVPHWGPRANTYFSQKIRDDMQKLRDELEAMGIATSKRVLKRDPVTGTVLQRSGRRAVHGPVWEAPDVPDNNRRDGKTTDKAVELLSQQKDDPFFLAVGYIKPHLPFVAPKRYFDLYPLEDIKLADNSFYPEDVPDCALYSSLELRVYSDVVDEGPIPDEKAREVRRAYWACVSFIDAQVGRLLKSLDDNGLRDNTIVVLWGDHGWHLGENDIWGKMTNFEIATRVPMIISYPGQEKMGAKTDALTEFVDIYPTLCELCGLPIPESLEGTSMVPLMKDPQRRWKTAAFSQYPRRIDKQRMMGHSMRTDRYRYTEWRDRKSGNVLERELYDHRSNSKENVNIANIPSNAKLVERLAEKLREGWQAAKPSARAKVSKRSL
jgi:iduronate 2-sulfatase